MGSKKKTLTAIELAEMEVRQLKIEADLPRMNVSDAIKEMQDYIDNHQNDDYLVLGFEQSPKKNPFRKKKSYNNCTIL